MDKLKTCPFCGSEAELYEGTFPDRTIFYHAYCTECLMRLNDWFDTKPEAIKAWNRRVK